MAKSIGWKSILFAFKLLREDFRNKWKGEIDIAQEKYLLLNELQAGKINFETYKSMTSRAGYLETVFNQEQDFYENISKRYLRYLAEYLNIDENDIPFERIYFETDPERKRKIYWMEAKASVLERPYTIKVTLGTAMYLDALGTMYGTVAGKIPSIKDLVNYKHALEDQYFYNSSSDSRSIIERVSKPHDAYIVPAPLRYWTVNLHPVQISVGKDITSMMTLFLLGHEFGHIAMDICRIKNISYPAMFFKAKNYYAERFNIDETVAKNWASESFCDYLGYYLSVWYVKHSTAYFGEDLGFVNAFSLLTSRGTMMQALLTKETQHGKDADKRKFSIDHYVRILTGIKVVFWRMAPLATNTETHPSTMNRLAFLHHSIKEDGRMPEYIVEAGNAIDLLNDCLNDEVLNYDLDHPFAYSYGV